MAIITINDVKAYWKIEGNDDDNVLQSFINQSVSEVENFIGYSIESATNTSYFTGHGRLVKLLTHCPVSSITTLKYKAVPTDSYTTVSASNYSLFQSGGLYQIYNNETFYSGYLYELVCVRGFAVVPQVIKSVLMEMTAQKYRDSGRGLSLLGVTSQSVTISGGAGTNAYTDLWEHSWKSQLYKYREIPT